MCAACSGTPTATSRGAHFAHAAARPSRNATKSVLAVRYTSAVAAKRRSVGAKFTEGAIVLRPRILGQLVRGRQVDRTTPAGCHGVASRHRRHPRNSSLIRAGGGAGTRFAF